MKKIVIINQDSGYLMIDLANAISAKNDTSLISGRLVTRNTPLKTSIKFRKIIKYHRNNRLQRFLSWIIAFFQIFLLIKIKHRHDYLLIVSNPPFAIFIPLLCRNRFSLFIFDVFPDTLSEMGLLSKDSFLVRLWKDANRKVFSKADNIFTISDSMASRFGEYSDAKKVTVFPVWSDNAFFKPVQKSNNPFVIEHNLGNRFVILYSGNLGVTHNVEIIPELAAAIDNPDILFVIIGDGDRRKWLKGVIQKRGLKNCLILPLQPVEQMRYSFASADLAIVSLGAGSSGLSLPSKTFNFMSAGLPLLCIAGKDSELLGLVEKYNNGKCFSSEQIDAIVSFINEIAFNRERQELFSANSLKASYDFTSLSAELIAEKVSRSIDLN